MDRTDITIPADAMGINIYLNGKPLKDFLSGAIGQVKEFHTAFGHPIVTAPALPFSIGDRAGLRVSLILEEADEFKTAVAQDNIVEVADALCDLLYVTIGAALEFGLGDKLKEMFDEVHRSNMSKLDANGNPIYRSDGKSLKGPNYSPPNLAKFINK